MRLISFFHSQRTYLCRVMLTLLAFGMAVSPRASTLTQQTVPANRADHPAPTQPLPYSHKVHLALGLQCATCHTGADPGKQMTFPGTETCMACHATVAKDSPAIKKLSEYAKSGERIPWVRVYVLTPGVTWSHRTHLKAGVKCENCHGAVAQGDAMSMATSVTSMAVCIDCHAQRKAKTVCQTCHAWPNSKSPAGVLSYDRNGLGNRSLTAASLLWDSGFAKHIQ